MKRSEYLLNCLAEECSETIKDTMKATRFGLYDINPNQPLSITNIEKVEAEFLEAVAVYWMLVDEGVFTFNVDKTNKIVEDKQTRVRTFMEYSQEKGIIEN